MFLGCNSNHFRILGKCLNRANTINKTVIKYLSTETFLPAPVKLAYASYENGASPTEAPLVIVHGVLGSKQNWASLCKAYSQKINRKVIAIDLRNHGESTHTEDHSYSHLAEDVRHFLEENNIQKVSLMGHSMGGRCAMLVALKYPEYIENLIVVDISPFSLSPNINFIPQILKSMQGIELPKDVSLAKARSLIDGQLARVVGDKDLRAFVLTNLTASGNNTFRWKVNVSTLLKRFDGIATFPLVEGAQYDGPTLFLGGGSSKYLPKSDFPKILKLFPRAELKYIAGAGHWLHAEKPNEFLKVTMEFLNKKD